jgi:hypothetical protein
MRGITTRAVVSDEMASTVAQVVSTASRADDTPVSSDTTTNTFSGTRNRAESCAPYSQHLFIYPKNKELTVARCSFEINDPRSMPCTG